ncbi:MAG: response regulator [Desulfosarcina sp.]|jgi:DNA-binding response OmpR family regulator
MPQAQANQNENVQSILIVDDDEMILEILSKGFEMYGLDVVIADNGLDGWELFKKNPVKIVLTDISMPGLDGIELSRRIRNASPNTTIALMTGGDAYIAAELLNDRTAKYLFTKPFAISDVCKSLIPDKQSA